MLNPSTDQTFWFIWFLNEAQRLMKSNLVTLIVLAVLLVAFHPAAAQDLDLTPYARVTATDTRNTFFLLWPRETDDATATIRDGDVETAWKTPISGEQRLTIDFAPTTMWPISFSKLSARWSVLPAGGLVSVEVFEACGGDSVFHENWDATQNTFDFPETVRGYCLEIGLNNPGAAALESLQVFASPASDIPQIGKVSIQATDDSLSVFWKPINTSVHHVELHFVMAQGEESDAETLIDEDLLPDAWQGPLPPNAGYLLAVVPVAADGTKGATQYVELPARANSLMPSTGVIEGFYGRPWSPTERRNMLLFMARIGMRVYAYGPKNDPLHRDNWRELYGDEKMTEFANLERLAENLGISFVYGISPGKDIDTESDTDRQALLDKLTPFIDIGVTSFVLLFDDIEGDIAQPINAELGAEHVELGNWLLQQLGDLAGEPIMLWLVPTVYSSERQYDWPEGEDYLREMAGLDSRIGLMWTGTGTSEDTLSAADVAEVTSLTGRKPIIWDNQHATDGGDGFWGHVFLAPLLGRSADLVDAVDGFMVNPMILGSANRMMLHTYAAYLHDPLGYDPDQALVDNADLIGATAADLLLALRQARSYYGYAGSNLLGQHTYPEMEWALRQFRETSVSGDPSEIAVAAAALMKIAAEMVVSQNDLWHSGLDPLLVDDLWYPSLQLVHDGYAILHTLDSVRDRFSGGDGTAAQDAAKRYLSQSAFDRYQLSPFIVAFWYRALAMATLPSISFSAPAIAPPSVNKARVESSWVYDTGLDGDVAIYGLPGAEITGGVVSWIPKHAGIYRVLVVGGTSDGWSWSEFSLSVSGEPSIPGGDDDDDDTTDDDDDDNAADDDSNEADHADDDDEGCGC